MKLILTPLEFKNDILLLLDQTKLPLIESYVENNSIEDVYWSIKDMIVRGAPLIGYSGIFGLALWLKSNTFSFAELKKAADYLKSSRPTAVNLSYEIDCVLSLVQNCTNNKEAYQKVVSYGLALIEKNNHKHERMVSFVIDDLFKRFNKKKFNILTHCNTGFLACGTLGTALGVITKLAEQDLINNVWVDETRPYLQGSRLTAYELSKLNIPHQIVVEGAASHLMATGQVDAIVVGADRIALNGDTANKIGTSNLSVIAKYYNVPFYVLAPKSSFDPKVVNGNKIEIELRNANEITMIKEFQVSPYNSKAYNPSFDITDSKLITAIACEDQIMFSDFESKIGKMFNEKK